VRSVEGISAVHGGEEVNERCDASDGVVRDWFYQVSASLGQVASTAPGSRQALADQVYAAVVSNGYGQFDPIVRDLGPALGAEGLAHLRLRLESLRQRSTGATEAKARPNLVVSIAMLAIADVLGDAEAYLAEYRDHHPEVLMVPAIAAKVAERLTNAGRAEEALTLLQAADPASAPATRWRRGRVRCAAGGAGCPRPRRGGPGPAPGVRPAGALRPSPARLPQTAAGL
jgi:hypothetical protein